MNVPTKAETVYWTALINAKAGELALRTLRPELSKREARKIIETVRVQDFTANGLWLIRLHVEG